MRTTLCLAGLMLATATIAQEQSQAVSPSPQTEQTQSADLMTMTRDPRCGQVLVTCLVGGQALRMMLDTGATHTVLHTESADKLKQARWLDTSKMMFRGNAKHPPKMLVASLQAGGASAPEFPFMVLPLDAVRQSLVTPIDGILGMDVLGGLPFTFDLRKHEYYWGMPTGGTFEQLYGKQDQFGRLIMQVTSTGKQLALLLDTGSSITRVHQEDWRPGTAGKISAHVGDVNAAASIQVEEGKPADMEVARGIVLKGITPIFAQEGQPPVLGMDALKGQVLIHMPLEDHLYGVFLMQK
ncbi:MAG: clan AA aspartic protease [Akkermansia sp.]|nr:clan AA aspartic protease [Akkermansia sp.]